MPGTKTPGRSVYLRYYAPVPNAKGKVFFQFQWMHSKSVYFIIILVMKITVIQYWWNIFVDVQKRKREELPVFEQAENVENPLRCPVKLYEFYLSKA